MESLRLRTGLDQPATVLVIGGGIGGMRSALDLANSGLHVYLIERSACLGGRVAQLGFMFPQHDCVLCRGTPDHGYGCTRPSLSPAYIQHNQHPNIEILTNTQVVDLAGQAGDFTVSLRQEPRYVDAQRCINCGYCGHVCPVELPDEYQLGMTMRKAAYKVSARAAPDAYVIDKGPYCDECGKCVEVCPTGAIDLNDHTRLFTLGVGAIVLALGFETYDATQLEELGYGRYANVIQAMQYERIASRSGPTEGMVVRPSDGKAPKSIAWLQCVGSRNQTNKFCSSICCMYATKEAILAKQRLGEDVECTVFIMDERAFNKGYSSYFEKARSKHKINYIRCRVSEIQEDPLTRDLMLKYVGADGRPQEFRSEIVVLATGLQPHESAHDLAKLFDIELNEHGFCLTDKFTPLQTSRPGVFVCGAFSSPKEISETVIDASGAAAEVMRLLNDRLDTYQFTRYWPFLSKNDLPEERDVNGEPVRTGVFTCACGGTISDTVDVHGLAQQAAQWPDVAFSEVVDYACFPETVEQIKGQIRDHKLNRAVVAACSNRTHEPLFQRMMVACELNPYLLEVVNLRDQCARVHRMQPDLANHKATELVRVAAGRVAEAVAVHKDVHRCRPTALVIGGGVSGITAALAIADSGYDVHLVERTETLGGNLNNLYYVAEGYNPQRLLRDLLNRVRAHHRIATFTQTEVVQHRGHSGYYRAILRTTRADGSVEERKIEHGVTIVTTGGYETEDHPWLELPHELEEMLIHRPEEIAGLKDVVMVQCVRPPDTPEYCSRVCCTNAMKNAIRLKLFNPNCRVSVLYKNIVTYGFREDYYTEAREKGVVFIRYTEDEPPELVNDNGKLLIRIRESVLNRWVELPADLVPVSMAIAPAKGTKELAELLRLPLSGEGFFEEAQLKLRPMDFVREGIFLAGMAHYPKFLEESISHALAAAARALPLLSKQKIYLGGVVAQVDAEKCVGCLTCTRTCPFEIPQIRYDEKRPGVGGLGNAAYIDATQCQGCGTCTGECPANAIQLIQYTDEQMMLQGMGGWEAGKPISTEGLHNDNAAPCNRV